MTANIPVVFPLSSVGTNAAVIADIGPKLAGQANLGTVVPAAMRDVVTGLVEVLAQTGGLNGVAVSVNLDPNVGSPLGKSAVLTFSFTPLSLVMAPA